MKKTGSLLLALFLLCSVLLAAGIIWFSATDYKGAEVLYAGYDDAQPVSVRLSNDKIKVTDVYADGNRLYYTVLPVQTGKTELQITPVNDSSRILAYGKIYVLPFGRVIANVSTLDCNGSFAVILIMLADVAVITAAAAAAFCLCRKRAAFGYTMINCGGAALFFAITLVTLTVSLFGGSQAPVTFGKLFRVMATSCKTFISVTAPFMTAFAVAVILSNILLMRREGIRLLQLPCIVLAVLWIVVLFVNVLFRFGKSGSAVLTGISNVLAVIVGFFTCLLLSAVVVAWSAAHRKPTLDRDYIVILSGAVQEDGTLTPLLQRRVDSALAFAQKQYEKTGRHAVFVSTGGRGKHDATAPSAAVQRYLTAHGVPAARMIAESRSSSTFQNLLYAGEIIEKYGGKNRHIAFATSDYHMLRSYVLAARVPLYAVQGIASKTKWVYYPNSILREMLGLMAQDMHIHALIITLLAALSFFATLVTYLR